MVTFKNHSKSGIKILRYNCHDGRLEYYTQQKGTNSTLNRMVVAIGELESRLKNLNEPVTKDAVRLVLDKILHKVDDSLHGKMNQVVDKMELGKILTPKKKKRYSPGSIKTFRFTLSLLERFGRSAPTMANHSAFISWCQEKDYALNYIGGQIKNWRSLAKKAGATVPDEFSKISEDTFDIYLDEDELKAIYDLPLTGLLDRVRDWFILDCYTGLRVSDLTLLNNQNYSNKQITIANEKTDAKVVIPAHPYVRQLRIKHKGFPPAVTSHQINIYMKTIARSAGVDNDILHTITKGGKRVDTYLKKYEMVSCHTARRSFITNLRKNGVPDAIIMKLTGIESSATLKRYDKMTPDEAAKIAAGLKFFK